MSKLETALKKAVNSFMKLDSDDPFIIYTEDCYCRKECVEIMMSIMLDKFVKKRNEVLLAGYGRQKTQDFFEIMRDIAFNSKYSNQLKINKKEIFKKTDRFNRIFQKNFKRPKREFRESEHWGITVSFIFVDEYDKMETAIASEARLTARHYRGFVFGITNTMTNIENKTIKGTVFEADSLLDG